MAAGLWVSALLRRVHATGDFATVLYRGDDVAGSVIIIHRDRTGTVSALSRVVGVDGTTWRVGASGDSVDDWVARQRGYDPDLWVIELDTRDLARFVDETTV